MIWPWSRIYALELEIVRLKNDLRSAEMSYSAYLSENRALQDKVRVLEADEREIRLNLLRRSGILPSEAQIDSKDREFKPVKKTLLPWSQAAAKLEADSRERYWKKQIEIREAPPEVRKKAWEQGSSLGDIDKDLAVLNNVSSS